MNTTNTVSTRSVLAKTALLSFALTLALVQVPALHAADTPALQPLADMAPALPVTTSVSKVTGAEAGPFVLKITNTSSSALKVTAKVLLAVAFHADNKAKHLPEQTIEAGASWSVADLALDDKVVLTAAGFAPLEVSVK